MSLIAKEGGGGLLLKFQKGIDNLLYKGKANSLVASFPPFSPFRSLVGGTTVVFILDSNIPEVWHPTSS